MKKKTPEEIKKDLKQFTGTSHYYQHQFATILYTNGIEYIDEDCPVI